MQWPAMSFRIQFSFVYMLSKRVFNSRSICSLVHTEAEREWERERKRKIEEPLLMSIVDTFGALFEYGSATRRRYENITFHLAFFALRYPGSDLEGTVGYCAACLSSSVQIRTRQASFMVVDIHLRFIPYLLLLHCLYTTSVSPTNFDWGLWVRRRSAYNQIHWCLSAWFESTEEQRLIRHINVDRFAHTSACTSVNKSFSNLYPWDEDSTRRYPRWSARALVDRVELYRSKRVIRVVNRSAMIRLSLASKHRLSAKELATVSLFSSRTGWKKQTLPSISTITRRESSEQRNTERDETSRWMEQL